MEENQNGQQGNRWQKTPDQWHQGIPSTKKVNVETVELSFGAREAINVLRGNIQLSGYKLKVVAVTSSQENEGKSSMSFELARSLASLEKKVAFLDCDIRTSVTRSRYKVTDKVRGLSEYLVGEAPIRDIVYKTQDPWLDLIFTGAVAPNPSELISNELFNQLISQLRDYYDYVIIDTPPINAVVDGVIACKQCDGTLLVVSAGTTERGSVIHAKRQLEFAGVKVLGVILNKIGGKKGGYGYGYGYGKSGKEKDKGADKK